MSSLIGAAPARLSEAGRHTFRSLAIRNYRLWFLGQVVSLCGTWMQSIAQSWLVVHIGGSAVDLGITSALQFGPVLVLGALGGVVADRFDKRRILIATQSAFLVEAAVMFALVATGVVQLWMVWAMALVMGAINSLDSPARQSFPAEMVGREHVANAVGLNSVMVNASRIVGPAIAGILIATAGLSWAFLVNAASFLFVLAALVAMRPGELHRAEPLKREPGQLRAGVRYALGSWQLRVPLLMMVVMGTLSYNFSVTLPLVAHEVFRRGGGTYGALTAAMGVGALAGALFVASRRYPRYRLLVAVSVVFGVFELGVALAPSLPMALLLLMPMGAGSVGFIALAQTMLQLHSAPEMRGRVMAMWSIVFLGTTPIGGPVTGLVAGAWGARAALAMGGVAGLVAAAGALVALWRIRAARTQDELAGVPAAELAEARAAELTAAASVPGITTPSPVGEAPGLLAAGEPAAVPAAKEPVAR